MAESDSAERSVIRWHGRGLRLVCWCMDNGRLCNGSFGSFRGTQARKGAGYFFMIWGIALAWQRSSRSVRNHTFEISLALLRVESRVLSFHMYHKILFLVRAEWLAATFDWTCNFGYNVSAQLGLSTKSCAAIWACNGLFWSCWGFRGSLKIIGHFSVFIARNCTVWYCTCGQDWQVRRDLVFYIAGGWQPGQPGVKIASAYCWAWGNAHGKSIWPSALFSCIFTHPY